ncbi:MAG TPA: amidohydrolase family protein [Anaeromyxobacteraceae bacterium]|nr:amidohydrolase family protein [Anaeromyxobacteraceae bacterium]
MTVTTATVLVASLCITALATALGLTQLVERQHPEITNPLREEFAPLSIRRIDFDEHLPPVGVGMALRVAQLSSIGALVNLSGGATGGELEAQLAAARPYGDRAFVFMNPRENGGCTDASLAREASRLADGKALGARGFAVPKGPACLISSRAAEALWEACATLGLPVALGTVGSLAERIRLVERHPRVNFVATRFAQSAANPAEVARLMDRLPNLWVDTAGSIAELGRRPAAARQAILGHVDRVIFGSGVRYADSRERQPTVLSSGLPVPTDPRLFGSKDRQDFFDSALRFFETRDSDIPSPLSADISELTGIGLPREALEKIYHQNVERLLRMPGQRVEVGAQ